MNIDTPTFARGPPSKSHAVGLSCSSLRSRTVVMATSSRAEPTHALVPETLFEREDAIVGRAQGRPAERPGLHGAHERVERGDGRPVGGRGRGASAGSEDEVVADRD